MEFTPKQLHYFKRELIIEQLKKEIDSLINSPDISSLLDQNQQIIKSTDEYPLIRYIFHNIIIEFPLLKHTCDENFWPKCKVFLNEFNKVQLSSFYTPRRSESNMQRKAIQLEIQKSLVFAFCASIKTFQGQEESIRIDTTSDTANVTSLPASPTRLHHHQEALLRVNIVAVRENLEKKTLRDVSHAEFLIETWFPHETEPVYVARRHGDFRRLRDHLKYQFKKTDIPLVPAKSANTSMQQGYRENDRLLLRTFLYQLIGNSLQQQSISKQQKRMQKSQAMKKFLTENPVLFTMEEEKDTLVREEADKHRLLEQQEFQKELDKRVYELNNTLEVLKKDILQPGGLIGIFDVIKNTKLIDDLPASLKKALEWGRINFAFALHRQFLTSDTATENYNNLRRTHGLMPYKTISVILRFSNPMSMMKGMLDLFLAQPFGGRSLFQRLIISNLNEESKAFQKDILILEEKIDDEVICQKIYNAVRTPIPENSNFRDYESRTLELLALLRNDDIEPLLSTDQITMLATFDETHKTRKLVKHIHQLWELYARQYEQELMMDLVFQGVTGELLKEFISVFYQPLAQVYKAADIGTTIRHVAAFLDDLVEVIEQLQQRQQSAADEKMCRDDDLTVTNTIELFIDLVQRHEQHFYDFVHNVHSQEASRVFDELVQYLDKLFTFVSHGIPGKLDIYHCVEKAGIDSKQELEALTSEIDAICNYRYKQKMYHFERQRRKLMLQGATKEGLAQISQTTDKERQDEIFQYIPKRSEVIEALGDLDEFDTISDNSSDEDCGSGASLFESNASSGSSLRSRRSSKSSASHAAEIEPPKLTIIPRIVPFFIDDVVAIMNRK